MKSVRIAAALACFVLFPATSAMADDGAALFKKNCAKCHSLEAGKHNVGPSLAGIVGKKAGQQDYKKYKALTGSDVMWNDANLDAWIADPKAFIGKATTMVVKIKTAEERAAIIAYIKAN